jgi:hypothetical protein
MGGAGGAAGGAAGEAVAGGAGGATAAEAGWLGGLHISGYASQTFGMWQNPTNLKQFTPSRNNLATSRTLLQVDENYRVDENNTLFMREWFVYEPPYAWDSANIKNYNLGNFPPPIQPPPNRATPSYGHFMNDWYNVYQVRDAWWENKTGPLTTFVGNQIVVWGQSIAFRVGDVINPVDTAWNFGFSNLEQSRNAQWMIHPILNLPEIGPMSSNFLEAVVQPGFAPQWWECDYPDGRYRDECEAIFTMTLAQCSVFRRRSSRAHSSRSRRRMNFGVAANSIRWYGQGSLRVELPKSSATWAYPRTTTPLALPAIMLWLISGCGGYRECSLRTGTRADGSTL